MVRILLDEEEIEILNKIGGCLIPTCALGDLKNNHSFNSLFAAKLIGYMDNVYGEGYFRTDLCTACLENKGKF